MPARRADTRALPMRTAAAAIVAALVALAPLPPASAADAKVGVATTSAPAAPPGMVTLSPLDIEAIVLAALAEQHIDTGGAGVVLSATSASVAIAADARLTVQRLTYHPTTRRFGVVLTATGSGGPPQRLTFAGRLQQTLELPVPNRRIQAGEVIQPQDLQWQPVHDRTVPAAAVVDPQSLIGRTPRRSLAAGQPVVAADVRRPTLVAKGALVTMVLAAPNMQLATRGRALDAGGAGDAIRVANAQSNAVVSGVVLDDGRVAVGGSGPVTVARGREQLR